MEKPMSPRSFPDRLPPGQDGGVSSPPPPTPSAFSTPKTVSTSYLPASQGWPLWGPYPKCPLVNHICYHSQKLLPSRKAPVPVEALVLTPEGLTARRELPFLQGSLKEASSLYERGKRAA